MVAKYNKSILDKYKKGFQMRLTYTFMFLIIFILLSFNFVSANAQPPAITSVIANITTVKTNALNSALIETNTLHYPPLTGLPSAANSEINPLSPIPSPGYDEQILETFTPSYYSLVINVTAVQQSGNYGWGPAYLLNGLSNQGYWYQVGLSYNWTPGDGFALVYAVFNPSGQVILPDCGSCGGLASFTGPVNPNDKISLYLYFLNGDVIMYAYDWNTGAYATESYSAEGATYFLGNENPELTLSGFFTGLMTEQYHVGQYRGTEQPVNYTIDSSSALPSAWLYMDEANTSTGAVWGICDNSCLFLILSPILHSFNL